jgi:hypothetical protein
MLCQYHILEIFGADEQIDVFIVMIDDVIVPKEGDFRTDFLEKLTRRPC